MQKNENTANQAQQLLALLNDLEGELRDKSLWDEFVPSETALNSTVPFSIDTLTFCQWLQFVFIPKMEILVRQKLPLPTTMLVLPMAEESFKSITADSDLILTIIGRLDLLLCESLSESST